MAEPFVIAEFVPAQKISSSVKITIEAEGAFRFDTELLTLGQDGQDTYGVYGRMRVSTVIKADNFSEAMRQYLVMDAIVSVGGCRCP